MPYYPQQRPHNCCHSLLMIPSHPIHAASGNCNISTIPSAIAGHPHTPMQIPFTKLVEKNGHPVDAPFSDDSAFATCSRECASATTTGTHTSSHTTGGKVAVLKLPPLILYPRQTGLSSMPHLHHSAMHMLPDNLFCHSLSGDSCSTLPGEI